MRQNLTRARLSAIRRVRTQLSAEGFGKLQTDLVEAIYRTHIRRGDTVFDLGAHLGYHVGRLAECVGPKGHLHAVEAVPDSCRRLRASLERIGMVDRVTVWERALASQPGVVDFTIVEKATGRSGLAVHPDLHKEGAALTRIALDASTLDVMFADLAGVSFIKVNLQGGEFGALIGGASLLKRAAPVIAFENGRQSTASLYGYSSDAFFNFFDAVNYDVFDVLGFPFTRKDWMAGGLPWWFVGVPRQRTALQGSIQGAIDAHLDSLELESALATA